MRYLTTLIAVALLIIGCSTVKYVPVVTDVKQHTIDSIAWHDSVIISYITKERIVDIAIPPDTLKMETDYAIAVAYADTTLKAIRGELKNKDTVPIKKVIQWKERIIRDTLVTTRDVPVEVEVVKTKTPTWAWYTLGFCIIVVLFIAIKIYFKFI